MNNRIVRRINPITNSINSLSVEKSEINQVLFPNPIDFLTKIDPKYLRIGNIKHDKNTHCYFIDTYGLFSSENGHSLLKELLQIIEERERERIVKEKIEKGESIINAIKYRLELISSATNKKYISKINKELKNIENLLIEKEIPLDTFVPDYIFYPYYSGIDSIEEKYVINNIYPQHNTKIFQLPRFEGDRQWMFTTPPKFLNSKTKNKNILILDDGSSTG